MTKAEASRRVRALLKGIKKKHGEGVLVTTDPEGNPHAAWMGTIDTSDIRRVLTMTSPDCRKAINILQNPKVEWMFTDKRLETVVYLRGKARVIHELPELETAWLSLEDKSRAYFMQYINDIGMQFLIIETAVEEIEYTQPKLNVYEKIIAPFSQ